MSSHNLTLRHEAQVTYRCVLSAQGLESVIVSVTSGETVTVTVLPDTMYTIGCVGYGEQGQDLCVEGNTTITTREQRHNKTLQVCTHISTYSARDTQLLKYHIILYTMIDAALYTLMH